MIKCCKRDVKLRVALRIIIYYYIRMRVIHANISDSYLLDRTDDTES